MAILAVALTLMLPTPPARANEPPETLITVREPLPYGYQIGDTLVREVEVLPADGTSLADKALPKPGRANNWFDLRSIGVEHSRGGAVQLHLEDQVVNVPDAVKMISTPAFAVPLKSDGKTVKLPVNPAWVTIAPMTTEIVLGRDRLVDVQDDEPAVLVDTAAAGERIRLAALAALLPLLALIYCWTPWERIFRPTRPFARALREVRAHRRAADAAFWPEALRAFHRAIDATAGGTVFPGEEARLTRRHAGFGRMEADLGGWLEVSHGVFFGGAAFPEASRRQDLLRLLGEARSVERGIQ
jgi:mxaA protein